LQALTDFAQIRNLFAIRHCIVDPEFC